MAVLFPLIQAAAPPGRSPPRRRRSWGRWPPPPTSTPRWPAPSPPPSTAATTWRGPSPVCCSEAPGRGARAGGAQHFTRMAVVFNDDDDDNTFYLSSAFQNPQRHFTEIRLKRVRIKFAIKILLNIQVVSQYGFNKVHPSIIYQFIDLVIFLSPQSSIYR